MRTLDIDHEIAQRGIPQSWQNTYRRALAGSRPAAVKCLCGECQGWEDGARQAIRDCPSVGCPLHAVRPFQKKAGNVNAIDNEADNKSDADDETASDTREPMNAIKSSLEAEAKQHWTKSLADAKEKILNHLQLQGESARGYILFSTNVPESLWNEAIRSLLAEDKVQRRGEKRSTRYRLKEKL